MTKNPFQEALAAAERGMSISNAFDAIPESPADELEQRRAQTVTDSRRLHDRAVELGWPSRALSRAVSAEVTPTIARLRSWDFRKCILVLAGNPGVGKTVAAAAWMLGRDIAVPFIRASTFATLSRYDSKQRDVIFDAHALVLDDLGAEYLDSKGSFLVDLDELIDTYYGAERPLLITTNLTIKEFKARYGGRVEDRVRECGEWVTVTGESRRGAP